MGFAKDCRSTVIPALRYRDAHKAIDWLVEALGFEKQAVYDGPDGSVMHAQLTFGNGMIMLGSASNGGGWSKQMVQPDEIGMRETITTCLIVDDAAAMYASAKAAGAEIVQELAEMPYGGKAFGCRDPEGHLWSIGEYNPWA
jgi:uncharacterized glyoxalase superfamily protein PhnB